MISKLSSNTSRVFGASRGCVSQISIQCYYYMRLERSQWLTRRQMMTKSILAFTGWTKLHKCWKKLTDSPAYHTAILLHPSYKLYYSVSAWIDQLDRLAKLNSMAEAL
jgi:hypothetical protein